MRAVITGAASGVVSPAALLMIAATLSPLGWWSAPARAQIAASALVGIDYSAPADCPSAGQLTSLLDERARDRWRFTTGAAGLRYRIEVRDTPTGHLGRVQRAGDTRSSEPREVFGSSCKEVVQALVLTITLSLEERHAAPAAAPPARAGSAAASERHQPAFWSTGAGVGALAAIGSPMPVLAVFVENGPVVPISGTRLRRPDLRLGFAHARNDVGLDPGEAVFSFSAAWLDVCPLAAGLGSTTTARLCGVGEAGVLTGRGIDVEVPRERSSFWVAAGAVVRLRWGRGLVWGELDGGALVPLRRVRYVFDSPRIPVASVPLVTWRTGLSVGVTIR